MPGAEHLKEHEMEDDAPKKEGSGKAKAVNYDELDENIQTHKTQALKVISGWNPYVLTEL